MSGHLNAADDNDPYPGPSSGVPDDPTSDDPLTETPAVGGRVMGTPAVGGPMTATTGVDDAGVGPGYGEGSADGAGAAGGTDHGGVAATGDARVDAAMRQLAGAAGLAPAAQVAEYEAVHRALQDTLATVDES